MYSYIKTDNYPPPPPTTTTQPYSHCYKLYKNGVKSDDIEFTLGSARNPIVFTVFKHGFENSKRFFINIDINSNKTCHGIKEFTSIVQQLSKALTLVHDVRKIKCMFSTINKDTFQIITKYDLSEESYTTRGVKGVLNIFMPSTVNIRYDTAYLQLTYKNHIETHSSGTLTAAGEQLREDEKTYKLEKIVSEQNEKIDRLEKKLDELKEMLMYMPGSSVFHEAKQDFDARF